MLSVIYIKVVVQVMEEITVLKGVVYMMKNRGTKKSLGSST